MTVTMPTSAVLDLEWWRSDPQDDFAALRAHDGIWRDDGSGIWLAARHADVLAVERDSATFASRDQEGGTYRLNPSPGEMTMISHDDPQHLAQRRQVNRRFTPRAVRSHTEHYTAIIDELVDGAIAEHASRGSVEVVDAIAAQLPCRVTAELIGFGSERWREVKDWSERQMRIDTAPSDPALFESFIGSIQEWATIMQDVLPQRAAEPAEDLFSDWIANQMDPMAMVQETGLLIAGGAETTRTVIAHGLRTFVDHPDQWEAIAADPALAAPATEELIRWVTPLNNMFRQATRDTELAGTAIAAGERIALVYPAANKDETVWDDPQVFDITRDPNPHLSFGHGTHFCLGANVARAEVRLLLEVLTHRVTNLRAVTEPDVEPNIFARAVRSFELGFDLR
ncbi:MAG: cytochrome P450 [Acidimicrobiales bacterium]|nr:MAG: cytochrome P450 [Acidimicrobiales bacterium]